MSFAGDLDSGFYAIGANNIGLSLGGSKVVDYKTTGVSITGTLGSSGNFAINTDKFTVAASSGNTAIAGTLSVTGATSLAGLSTSGNASVGGTLSVTGATTLTGALTANNSAGATARNIPKAFAKFTQSGTTVSFTSGSHGHNIASITRTGAGVYDIVFSSALPTANYAVVAMGFNSSDQACFGDAQSRTTSGFTLTLRGGSNLASPNDVARCDFTVLGY
jgi:hypothetical protein